MKKSKLLQAVLGVILAGAPLFAATTVIKSAVNDKNVKQQTKQMIMDN